MRKMSKMKETSIFLLLAIVVSCAYAYPAVGHPYHAHVHKRQSSYGRSNQLAPPQEPYAQASYNQYNYNNANANYAPRSHSSNNGFYQNDNAGYYQQYDYAPSRNHHQQYNYGRGSAGEPLQGAYANPIQRELTVRNGQLRQKEYQQRTGQEGRDTYDPFYFYVNPIAATAAAGNALVARPPQLPPSSALPPASTSVSTSGILISSATSSREHVGGPPRNRRNSLNARDPYFENEISRDKYEILGSNKPSYPRNPNSYPAYPSSRYSSGNVGPSAPYRQPGAGVGRHQHPGNNHNSQFLNYEQIVGAEPPRYASGQPSRGGQPWSIQIGTQLKVNDDGKGPNSGSRFYVRDERNTRPRHPPYRK